MDNPQSARYDELIVAKEHNEEMVALFMEWLKAEKQRTDTACAEAARAAGEAAATAGGAGAYAARTSVAAAVKFSVRSEVFAEVIAKAEQFLS